MITMLFCALAVSVCLTADLQRRHERVLRNAISKSGQTMLQAAQEAEIDKGQFTRQIQMIEGSHKRLAMQPIAFWQWLAVEIVSEFGLPKELETAARLQAASDLEMAS
jgi:hypothetical protein